MPSGIPRELCVPEVQAIRERGRHSECEEELRGASEERTHKSVWIDVEYGYKLDDGRKSSS